MGIRRLARICLVIAGGLSTVSCGLGDLFGGGGRSEETEVERIAFVRENQVHTSWLRTARLETLTDPGVFSPTWSPDGNKLAFIELIDGVEVLSTVNSNGENKTGHFSGDIGENLITWDNDGRSLLFLSGQGGAMDPLQFTAMRVDTESNAVQVLGELQSSFTHFRWSPLGDRLFYIALSSSSWDISFLDIDAIDTGSVEEDTRRDEIFPTVSPDGSMIAYISQRGGPSELRVHTLATGNHVTVADTRLAQWPPVWSWDNSRLAFVKEGQIWSVGVNGSGLEQLTTRKANYRLVGWSPSGSELIYRANIQTDRIVQVSSEVYIFRMDDRSSEQILDYGEDLDILWKRN